MNINLSIMSQSIKNGNLTYAEYSAGQFKYLELEGEYYSLANYNNKRKELLKNLANYWQDDELLLILQSLNTCYPE